MTSFFGGEFNFEGLCVPSRSHTSGVKETDVKGGGRRQGNSFSFSFFRRLRKKPRWRKELSHSGRFLQL